MSNAVAIIHARGGSKRIKLKNLQLLDGKPLLAYPIELVSRRPWISRVIVSTDHDDIMEAARSLGAEVPFRRPADIAEDVPSEMVALHALRFLESQGSLPKYMVNLTPATPFTRPSSLDAAFDLLGNNPDWDSVTTIRKAAEFPEWMLRFSPETGIVKTVLGNSLDGEYNVSQNLPPCYYPAGAFWINRVKNFLDLPSMYGRRWGGVVLDTSENVDIDWPEDLERARSMVSRSGGKDG